jgi:hypothetical protein
MPLRCLSSAPFLSRSWRGAAPAAGRTPGRAACLGGALGLAAALAGCAAYRDAELRPPVAAEWPSTIVVVARPGGLAWWRRDTVLVDGVPALRLRAGEAGAMLLTPGLHLLELACGSAWLPGSSAVLPLRLEAGVTYRLRAGGSIAAPCRLEMPPVGLFPAR